jgi:hypothetical protein
MKPMDSKRSEMLHGRLVFSVFCAIPPMKLEKLARWQEYSQMAAVFRKRFAYNYREKVGPKSLRMHQRLVEICKRMFEAGGVCELSSPV